MSTQPPSVAVIGAGISGLVAARELESRGLSVRVFEAEARVGGKIATGTLHGMSIEEGADSFLARDPCVSELCAELGLGDELVAPAVFGAHILRGGRLVRLPSGLPYGIPISPWSAYRTGTLSMMGALRAAAEPLAAGRLSGPDVSVASFISSRFGREALDHLVDPLLAGTRAGSTVEMSLAAALPAIDGAARDHRSVSTALRRARRASGESAGPPFLGLRGGLARMVEALRAGLGSVTTGTRVEGLRASAHSRYELTLSGGQKVPADGVVLTLPSYASAPLVAPLSPEASRRLATIDHASVAVISLVYPMGALALPPDGSGLLIPSSAGRMLSACTWFSQKWPHAAPSDGSQIVRAFVGRAGRTGVLDLDDDELADRAAKELNDILGSAAGFDEARVSRWDRSLPQYKVGHLLRVSEIEELLQRHPGIAVAGASYRGSGLPDCIRSARAAARAVERGLGSRVSTPTGA